MFDKLGIQFTKKGLALNGFGGIIIGFVFASGLNFVLLSNQLAHFGVYLIALSTFHFLEYFMTAIFHPDTLSFDSWIINHSKEYSYAVTISILEYWLEYFIFPSYLKSNITLSTIGIIIAIIGQTCRTLAMYQAGQNFTHIVQTRKKSDHKLVTNGIYQYFRHPAYFGHYWWSLGLQIYLMNPVCFFGFSFFLWFFFQDRILWEERFLIDFFGEDYLKYQSRTYIGIPFQRSFKYIPYQY